MQYYYIHYLDEANEKQLAIFTSKEHANAFRWKQGTRFVHSDEDKWSGDLDVQIELCGIADNLFEISPYRYTSAQNWLTETSNE